ncbi:MAG: hypothetical protein CVV14_09470 [Gammaproteobacteria bacterium HGW-Gammaproteobacteria-4]|jgi:hypothetical protein|nr:MAG: hypothetical protein CVV14_09470 [Gammaproteobacteria bacterium HGW-Gammaproteobacteria-4]PKO85050.1 MAG: hypothetical protein CVU18_22150 [Betaproteobacteria bacterium HGW-Betaproteobacteria-12]
MHAVPTQPRNDDEIQAAVRNLFLGAVPEREQELACLWSQYQLRFNLLPDHGRDGLFVMDAGAYRDVRFNHRALRAFWVATFSAWESFRVCAEGGTDLTRLHCLLDSVAAILNADDPTTVQLPPGVPEPGQFVDRGEDVQARAASELAVFATAWALLHEARHIQFQQEGTSTIEDVNADALRAEELACDDFATAFILDGIHQYSQSQGESETLVAQKRQTGIFFALFGMTVIGRGRWSESATHPSIQDRIQTAWGRIADRNLNQTAALLGAGAFMTLDQVWEGSPHFPAASNRFPDQCCNPTA